MFIFYFRGIEISEVGEVKLKDKNYWSWWEWKLCYVLYGLKFVILNVFLRKELNVCMFKSWKLINWKEKKMKKSFLI